MNKKPTSAATISHVKPPLVWEEGRVLEQTFWKFTEAIFAQKIFQLGFRTISKLRKEAFDRVLRINCFSRMFLTLFLQKIPNFGC